MRQSGLLRRPIEAPTTGKHVGGVHIKTTDGVEVEVTELVEEAGAKVEARIKNLTTPLQCLPISVSSASNSATGRVSVGSTSGPNRGHRNRPDFARRQIHLYHAVFQLLLGSNRIMHNMIKRISEVLVRRQQTRVIGEGGGGDGNASGKISHYGALLLGGLPD